MRAQMTGIPRIDKEHQQVSRLVETAESICRVGNARSCGGCILTVRDRCQTHLSTVMGTLGRYMRDHFRYEERLMNFAVPADHVAEHQAAHRYIQQRVGELEMGYSRDGNTALVSRQVVSELRAWLSKHMDTYDMVLALHVGSEDGH
jgi:hemerythrin-like metal-binding protein